MGKGESREIIRLGSLENLENMIKAQKVCVGGAIKLVNAHTEPYKKVTM